MNILMPWSLASYVPLNGFHPLYRSLASIDPDDTRLLVPSAISPEQYRLLIQAGVYASQALPLAPAWAPQGNPVFGFRDFVEARVSGELLYMSRITGDVELHHTAPATAGTRPFVLQFESFLPVLYPHLQQGLGRTGLRLEQVRDFYRALFEGENCLAITSHMHASLDQFSDFFRSKIIDDKLVYLRNGIDLSYRAAGVHRDPDRYNFLFINSAHQNPASFTLRGGVSCLELALNLLDDGLPVRFHFRMQRPDDAELKEFGIDPLQVRRYENSGIVWIDSYLSDEALSRLMAYCHFLLLPSANLHSVSILSAMANGTVPVVSDTYGTDAYVTDDVDGVVLGGVRNAAWHYDADARLMMDDHGAFYRMSTTLSRMLIARVRALLAQPEQIAALSHAARRRAETVFDGPTFATGLVDLIRSRFQHARKNGTPDLLDRHHIHDVPWGEEWTGDLAPAHFEGPPSAVPLIDMGSGMIWQLRNQYVHVPNFRLPVVSLSNWSELHFAMERYEQRPTYRKTISTSFEAVVEAALIEAKRQIGRADARLPLLSHGASTAVKTFIFYRLKRWPVGLRAARTAYRLLTRLV